MPKANRHYWAPKLARNVERDRANDEALTVEGWTVLRFFEHVEPDEAAAAVERSLRALNTSAVLN